MKKIIAEIGSSHDGSFGNAEKLILAAKDCKADIIKFQLHLPEYEMLPTAPSPSFFKSENRFDYFKRTNFNIDQLKHLKRITEKLKMQFMVSPFSEKALEMLETIDLEYYKVASGEVTNHKLLEKLKKTGKKIFMSTGMSNWKEIDKGFKILNKKKTVLMQCSSIYPCPANIVGLNVINELKKRYRTTVGFSDHYLGLEAGFAAAALGAEVIEKHITFSRKMYGSDAPNAMEIDEFKKYVSGIRSIWTMNENPVDKNNIKVYKDTKRIFEKSIIINKNLSKNHKIELEDLAFKKPGDGISAMDYKSVIGRRLKHSINENTKLKMKDLC